MYFLKWCLEVSTTVFSSRNGTIKQQCLQHIKIILKFKIQLKNEELVSLRKVKELSPVNAINEHQSFFKNLLSNVQAYSSHQCSLQQNSTLQPQLSL